MPTPKTPAQQNARRMEAPGNDSKQPSFNSKQEQARLNSGKVRKRTMTRVPDTLPGGCDRMLFLPARQEEY